MCITILNEEKRILYSSIVRFKRFSIDFKKGEGLVKLKFKVIVLFTFLLSFISILTIHASAETLQEGDFKYTILDSKVEIVGYIGAAKNVEIPAELNGMPVTSIGENAFFSKK